MKSKFLARCLVVVAIGTLRARVDAAGTESESALHLQAPLPAPGIAYIKIEAI